MSPKHIINLFKQAVVTFPSRKYPSTEIFISNLEKLKSLMDQLTKEHVNFDTDLLELQDTRGPCTYIQLYEDFDINISIFVVHQGHKLPLHDHPHMYGLLKVIAGSFKIQAYTEDKSLTSKLNNEISENSNENINETMRRIAARKLDVIICDEMSESCILSPGDGNYHEIEPIDGPAAFLDILSPPYNAFVEELGQRDCNYYKEDGEISPNVVELIQIRPPSWFWCDTATYLGPHLPHSPSNNPIQ